MNRYAASRILGATSLAAVLYGAGATHEARAAEAGAHSELLALSGEGSGRVEVAPTAANRPDFTVQITVNVHQATPGTTFSVARAADLTPDGVCESTSYTPFPVANDTFTVSRRGAGATHIAFERGAPFTAGTRFDVQFQVTGDGTVLQSQCMTVTVK
jgi:hypothetical protein